MCIQVLRGFIFHFLFRTRDKKADFITPSKNCVLKRGDTHINGTDLFLPDYIIKNVLKRFWMVCNFNLIYAYQNKAVKYYSSVSIINKGFIYHMRPPSRLPWKHNLTHCLAKGSHQKLEKEKKIFICNTAFPYFWY